MKTQNPLIGRSRKSYGDATFYTLNGENIVRTKPMMVSNPNTPAQEAQRTRFKAFTAAANSMSEADLNLIFQTKVTGRNRRSMLQAQLAPAYGTQATTDPTATEKYEPTFDYTKIDNIGSGAVGYIGNLAEVQISSGNISIPVAEATKLYANTVSKSDDDELMLVAISEDGCMLKVALTERDFSDIKNPTETISINSHDLDGFLAHGDTAYCYAVAGKLQLIGLGTFSVAERPARKGHNPKHNVPV